MGSEMCIRDRGEGRHDPPLQDEEAADVHRSNGRLDLVVPGGFLPARAQGKEKQAEATTTAVTVAVAAAVVAAAAMAPVGIFAPSDDQVLRYVATHVRSRGCTSVPFRTSCLSGRGEPLSLAPWWDSIEK